MKNAIITGASSGIGKGIYNFLVEQGNYNVMGISRRGPDYEIDLTCLSEINNFILFLKEGAVDLLVN